MPRENKSDSFDFSTHIKQTCQIHYVDSSQSTAEKIQSYITKQNVDKLFVVYDPETITVTNQIVSELGLPKKQVINFKSKEINKNLLYVDKIARQILQKGGSPDSVICAIGGGITGNLAGLLSSLLYRGIKLIHIPTTLLAQLDSAVDVKQSVNVLPYKNVLGSYKSPNMVIINPNALRTLSQRQIRSGLAEAIKHAFTQDPDFVDEIISCKDPVGVSMLPVIIKHTLKLKFKHWQENTDIWTQKNRTLRLTHLGHTTAKILEVIEPGLLTHGEAISHGMIIEAKLSRSMGYLSDEDLHFITAKLNQLGTLRPLTKQYTTKLITDRLYEHKAGPNVALLAKLGDPNVLSLYPPKESFIKVLDEYLA